MSGLFAALSSGAQSLITQSQGVQLAGKNLANSDTEGYARQRLVIGSMGTVETSIGAQSMGAQAVGIQQIRDQFLDAQMVREISSSGYLEAQDSNLLKAQADLGEQLSGASSSSSISDSTTATSGIASAIDDFFNAFENLAANAGDSGAKQVLVQKADLLASKINVTDSRLAALQSDITDQNTKDLDTVNSILSQVASLNGEIQKFELSTPNSAVDLRDQRQAKLEELAKYMNFTAQETPGGHGQVQVIATSDTGNPVTLVDKANVLGTVAYDSATKKFSGGVPAATLALSNGSLQGNVDVRDGVIAQLRSDIKSVADQLTASVNAAYNKDGSGNNFFSATPSGLISLDSTLSYTNLKTAYNGDAGGNDLALAVAGVAQTVYSKGNGDAIDGTIGGFYSRVASGLGQSVSTVESKLKDQQTIQSLVSTQRNSVSGVSQEEELTDLMKYQRGFQASSRVINVIDNLLDTIVNGLIK